MVEKIFTKIKNKKILIVFSIFLLLILMFRMVIVSPNVIRILGAYYFTREYSGEYDLQYNHIPPEGLVVDEPQQSTNTFKQQKVMTYMEYKKYCEDWELNQKYSDPTKKYIVFSYEAWGDAHIEARIADVKYKNNKVTLYIWDEGHGVVVGAATYTIVIPTTNQSTIEVDIKPAYPIAEINMPIFNPKEEEILTIDKPIIYLYPTGETDVSVKLGYQHKITCSYPTYKKEWNVKAKPNGDLIDKTTNRDLYALYYESENMEQFKVETTGFVIKGEDTISFLEEKLEILGLTPRESEEFIVYWLPKLEANKYNYIRFASLEEINRNMPLNITPNPDTLIRVLMTYKGLDKPIEIEEQKLETPLRKGFVAVEWGGTEIK